MFAVVRPLRLVCLLAWMVLPGWAFAAIWQDLGGTTAAASRGGEAQAVYYRALKADAAMLRQALAAAPLERTASQGAILELPMPGGENQRFTVELSPILGPALAARYPDIQTYRVTGIDNPAITGRLDMSPAGFHGMLTTPAGSVFIDPDGAGNYRSFYKQDYASAFPDAASKYVCHQEELDQSAHQHAPLEHLLAPRALSTNSRRTYRLVVVTTGEYGSYFGSRDAATAQIISTINRVNQIYGRDLAVQLQLIEVIVYTNAGSDPFDDPTATLDMLDRNQEVVDFAVGVDNYDIGHLFGLTGGGLAYVGVACAADYRAKGYTGHPTPDIGDPFDIDFVAHELGHQLNATHSFNGSTGGCSGNRTAATAVEPGSGTTIMAYAGVCDSEDIESYSDATFHAVNIEQINGFVFGGPGGACGSLVSTSNALPTTISAGADLTVPASTPFVLTGSASTDPDGDSLSYQWDEIDVGTTATTAGTIGTDINDNPLFRSFVPKSSPTRYFPRLGDLIAGSTTIGETLPTTSRTLNFRMTVRDGNSGVGDDDMSVTVVSSQGPFQVTSSALNDNSSFSGGTSQGLSWDAAGTDTDCPTVSISLLSINAAGTAYCDKSDDANLDLMTGVSNVAEAASVPLPSNQIARARVMISCETATRPFFAISDTDFTVNAAGTAIASDCKTMDGEPLEHGTVFVGPNLGSGTGLFGGGSNGGGGGALLFLPLLLALGGLLRRFSR